MLTQAILNVLLFFVATIVGTCFARIPLIFWLSVLAGIIAVVKLSTLIVLKTLVGFGIIGAF